MLVDGGGGGGVSKIFRIIDMFPDVDNKNKSIDLYMSKVQSNVLMTVVVCL